MRDLKKLLLWKNISLFRLIILKKFSIFLLNYWLIIILLHVISTIFVNKKNRQSAGYQVGITDSMYTVHCTERCGGKYIMYIHIWSMRNPFPLRCGAQVKPSLLARMRAILVSLSSTVFEFGSFSKLLSIVQCSLCKYIQFVRNFSLLYIYN